MCTFKCRKAKRFLSKLVDAGHQLISLINFFLRTRLLLSHGFPAKTPPTWGERWKHWRKTETKLKITLVQNITFTMDHILSIVVPRSGAKPTWWRLIVGSSTVHGAGEVNRGRLLILPALIQAALQHILLCSHTAGYWREEVRQGEDLWMMQQSK